MAVVNIPEFMLRACELHEDTVSVQPGMSVIVGWAPDTRTPLFDDEMCSVEFSHYWNVPPSVTRGATVPRLRRDPAYFRPQGFEFVRSDGPR